MSLWKRLRLWWLLRKAIKATNNMTPEERAEMHQQQRESWGEDEALA